MAIMGMMGLSTVDMEKEKPLAPNIRLVILLVLVLTMQHKSSFSRKLSHLESEDC